jgi:hypothetical protein
MPLLSPTYIVGATNKGFSKRAAVPYLSADSELPLVSAKVVTNPNKHDCKSSTFFELIYAASKYCTCRAHEANGVIIVVRDVHADQAVES